MARRNCREGAPGNQILKDFRDRQPKVSNPDETPRVTIGVHKLGAVVISTEAVTIEHLAVKV